MTATDLDKLSLAFGWVAVGLGTTAVLALTVRMLFNAKRQDPVVTRTCVLGRGPNGEESSTAVCLAQLKPQLTRKFDCKNRTCAVCGTVNHWTGYGPDVRVYILRHIKMGHVHIRKINGKEVGRIQEDDVFMVRLTCARCGYAWEEQPFGMDPEEPAPDPCEVS